MKFLRWKQFNSTALDRMSLGFNEGISRTYVSLNFWRFTVTFTGWWQLKYFLSSPRKLGKMNPFRGAYFKPPTTLFWGTKLGGCFDILQGIICKVFKVGGDGSFKTKPLEVDVLKRFFGDLKRLGGLFLQSMCSKLKVFV